MGRSSASCFKIIACGGSAESVDRDDIDASTENKGSDKRGWSFRKRSARHRVLSNTIVTEGPSSENKESSEPVIITSEAQVNPTISEKTSEAQVNPTISEKTSEAQVNPTISEKTSDNQWTEEMPQLSTSITKDATVSTMVTEAACEDDIKCESSLDESSVLIIQAAVRRFLAQREMVRHKNVVKLQAAVRGHLVRNHAVGSLRCVQAIVKMQALVRARNANLSAERSSVEEKGVKNPGTKSHPTYISIEKLLSNKFARQLMESTPRTKQINIKCDPSRSDSAWHWLERWMSVSSPDTLASPALDPHQDKVNNADNEMETLVPAHCEPTDMNPEIKEKSKSMDTEETLISHEEEKPQPANTHLPSDPLPDESSRSFFEKPVVSENEPKRPAKRLASDQADSEGRKSVFGSRKASNPAFIAAQSRFEELTSKTSSLKSVDSSAPENEICNKNVEPEELTSKTNSSNHDNDMIVPTKDSEPEESLVPHTSRIVPNGGSECGTELSITSTLDSPDHLEAENKKSEDEPKVLNETTSDAISTNKDLEQHDNGDSAETQKLKPDNNIDMSQDLDENPSDADIELEPESGHHVYKSNAHMELEPEREPSHHVYKSSLEGSPRSHMTVPESQGTPSSEISTSKKTKKVSSSQKRKSWSTSKKSPVSSSHDSGLRSSLEQLPKEPKSGKRRNSFGSPRPDHGDRDQEPRDSNSNTTLPSYMQATESARAKALVNSSPRSSPDVQDKEIYVKKRHSLPGAVNGRQGSPRIQRSMSQALQTTKGNGNQERKWQR